VTFEYLEWINQTKLQMPNMTFARNYPTFTFVLCMLALGFCRLEQMLMSGKCTIGTICLWANAFRANAFWAFMYVCINTLGLPSLWVIYNEERQHKIMWMYLSTRTLKEKLQNLQRYNKTVKRKDDIECISQVFDDFKKQKKLASSLKINLFNEMSLYSEYYILYRLHI